MQCRSRAAQDIQAQLAQFKESLSIPQAEYDSLSSIQTEMTGLGATSNPYSTHSWESIVVKWEQLQSLLPKRDEQLSTEAVKQQSHEQLRKDWAAHAIKVQEWVASQNAAIQAVIDNADNQKMDDQLVALKAIEASARRCAQRSLIGCRRPSMATSTSLTRSRRSTSRSTTPSFWTTSTRSSPSR